MRNGVEQEGACIIDGPSLRAVEEERGGEGANGPELAAAGGVGVGRRPTSVPTLAPREAAE